MKYLLSLAIASMLCACASAPYDRQFSTLETVDKDGVTRSHAWLIGPSRIQRLTHEAAADSTNWRK